MYILKKNRTYLFENNLQVREKEQHFKGLNTILYITGLNGSSRLATWLLLSLWSVGKATEIRSHFSRFISHTNLGMLHLMGCCIALNPTQSHETTDSHGLSSINLFL